MDARIAHIRTIGVVGGPGLYRLREGNRSGRVWIRHAPQRVQGLDQHGRVLFDAGVVTRMSESRSIAV